MKLEQGKAYEVTYTAGFVGEYDHETVNAAGEVVHVFKTTGEQRRAIPAESLVRAVEARDE